MTPWTAAHQASPSFLQGIFPTRGSNPGILHCRQTLYHVSYQFSSVQSLSRLRNPMNCTTPGLPVHHQLTDFTQTHVHRVSDAIQPSHLLSSPSPPAPNASNIMVFSNKYAFASGVKALEAKIYKQFKKLNIKKTNNPIKKCVCVH